MKCGRSDTAKRRHMCPGKPAGKQVLCCAPLQQPQNDDDILFTACQSGVGGVHFGKRSMQSTTSLSLSFSMLVLINSTFMLAGPSACPFPAVESVACIAVCAANAALYGPCCCSATACFWTGKQVGFFTKKQVPMCTALGSFKPLVTHALRLNSILTCILYGHKTSCYADCSLVCKHHLSYNTKCVKSCTIQAAHSPQACCSVRPEHAASAPQHSWRVLGSGGAPAGGLQHRLAHLDWPLWQQAGASPLSTSPETVHLLALACIMHVRCDSTQQVTSDAVNLHVVTKAVICACAGPFYCLLKLPTARVCTN